MIEHHPNLIAVRRFTVAACLALLAGCGAGTNIMAANKPLAAVPAGLAATAGNAAVTLKWTASSDATGYNVKRATTSGGPYTPLAAPTSTGYTDSSVINGTAYYYVVSSLDAAGESANSAEASATPEAPSVPPAAPTNLKATAGNAQASLTWSASSGATSFNLKRSTTSGGPYTQLAATTSPSYTDATVSNGTTYYYVVTAVNSGGESADSAEASVTPDPTITTPPVPTGLAATAGDKQVSLTWSASSGATSYHVKRATTSGGPYTQVAAPGSSAFTDTSVTDGTTYYYVVSALDSAGESANSAQVSALPVAPTAIPAVPAGLSATPGNGLVTLIWSPSSGASSYHVKRATASGGPYTQVGTPTSATYVDTSVTNATKYYYVVSALDTAGESSNSAQVSALPVAPTSGTSIVISPTVTVTSYGGTVQFMAVVTGSPGATSVWSMQETGNVGTIASNGLYTAPMVAGTYHVVATSSVDSKLAGTASVTVAAPQGTPPALVPGVWKDITPPAPGFAQTFGSPALEVSPVDPNVIYVPIDTLGLWKTTDRGSTWTRLGVPGTFQPGSLTTTYLDSPIRVQVDPGDPNHLIATQGVRGTTLGFWESHDAGNSWQMPQGFFDAAKTATTDVTQMAVDPTNFKHILLGSHSLWANSQTAGIMETTDGGQTWILHQGDPSWPAGSIGINFLYNPTTGQGNPNTWIVTTDGDGFWRTTNAGGTWVKVANFNAPHGGTQIYYAKNGTVYSGAAQYPARSHDNGATWEQVQGGLSYFYYYTVYGDGDTLYTQLSYTGTNGGQGPQPYMTAPETTGGPWTPYQGGAQKFSDGPFMMRYDAANQIMYSANWKGGLWALKVIKP